MTTPTLCPQELRLVKSREAAQRLCISERQLWAHTEPRGDIPAVRIGAAVRYSLAALEAYVQRRQQEGGE